MLGEVAAGLLGTRIDAALRIANRSGRGVASVCVPVPARLDLSAAVLGCRRADDSFFCLEQPGRDGYAVCGLGAAATIRAQGPGRFAEVAGASRALAAATVADDPSLDPDRPSGAGPVFTGGFAFAATGGQSPEWSSFAPAQLMLPEVSFARRGEHARMTVNVVVDGREPRDRGVGAGSRPPGRAGPAADAPARPRPDRPRPGGRGRAAVALRGGGAPRRRAHPGGRAGQGGARP